MTTVIDGIDLAYEFLNSINDEDLHNMLQRNISETMYSIEMCYNFEYREFLRKHDYKEWKNATIFNTIRAEEFAHYISERFNIKLKEVRYFEFMI